MARKNPENQTTPTATSTTETKSEKAAPQKHIQIVLLPPSFQFRTGHILRLAVSTDENGEQKALWSKKSSHSQDEFNTALTEIKSKAAKAGYTYTEHINGLTSYRDVRDRFARNPQFLDRDVDMVNRLISPRQQSENDGSSPEENYDII